MYSYKFYLNIVRTLLNFTAVILSLVIFVGEESSEK